VKIAKFAFFTSLFIALYYAFVWVVLPFFTDPRIQQFNGYHRLENWDLTNHAIDDFDQDGEKDLITFTGCAFFTSVDETTIPEDKKCITPGMAVTTSMEKYKIGQKYVDTDLYDLTQYHMESIKHSYVGNVNNDWYIFINTSNSGLRSFKVVNGGLLEETTTNWKTYLDEILYLPSSLFVIFALPLMPLQILFEPLLYRYENFMYPIHFFEILFFSTIATISFCIWRIKAKSNKSNPT